jgi:hypothetical protein
MYTWLSVDESMKKDVLSRPQSQLCDHVAPALHISIPAYLHYSENHKYHWRDRQRLDVVEEPITRTPPQLDPVVPN